MPDPAPSRFARVKITIDNAGRGSGGSKRSRVGEQSLGGRGPQARIDADERQVQSGADQTRTDALYFTVTVFSTVGFGDITAVTEVARVLVTGQMIAGIAILGLGARIIVDAVKRGQQRQPMQAGDAAPDPDGPLE